MKKVSAVIINYNTPELTERAIVRLLERADESVKEVILIDNGSTERMYIENLADERIRYFANETNLGFAGAANQGMRLAEGEFILLLNSDVIVEAGAVDKLAAYLEQNAQAGIVGPRMAYPDGEFQVSCGRSFSFMSEFIRLSTLYKYLPGGSLLYPNRFNRSLFEHGGQVGWVSGGCLMLRRAVLEQLGELDEKFFFGVEDIDYCSRATESGWQVVYLPKAKVLHYHGFSAGGRRTLERMRWERDNLEYFMGKHWPDRLVERKLVKLMHTLKISILRLFIH
ncbi:glycosyltransferase family 2 protein [Candidatus Falkowbacteria bacterium]|nr:glycosyltransferase family 2 protein [Candidatus Falkowbacteria bacterium]